MFAPAGDIANSTADATAGKSDAQLESDFAALLDFGKAMREAEEGNGDWDAVRRAAKRARASAARLGVGRTTEVVVGPTGGAQAQARAQAPAPPQESRSRGQAGRAAGSPIEGTRKQVAGRGKLGNNEPATPELLPTRPILNVSYGRSTTGSDRFALGAATPSHLAAGSRTIPIPNASPLDMQVGDDDVEAAISSLVPTVDEGSTRRFGDPLPRRTSMSRYGPGSNYGYRGNKNKVMGKGMGTGEMQQGGGDQPGGRPPSIRVNYSTDGAGSDALPSHRTPSPSYVSPSLAVRSAGTRSPLGREERRSQNRVSFMAGTASIDTEASPLSVSVSPTGVAGAPRTAGYSRGLTRSGTATGLGLVASGLPENTGRAGRGDRGQGWGTGDVGADFSLREARVEPESSPNKNAGGSSSCTASSAIARNFYAKRGSLRGLDSSPEPTFRPSSKDVIPDRSMPMIRSGRPRYYSSGSPSLIGTGVQPVDRDHGEEQDVGVPPTARRRLSSGWSATSEDWSDLRDFDDELDAPSRDQDQNWGQNQDQDQNRN